MNTKKHWRAHRFAPLSQLNGDDAGRPGVPTHMSAQLQVSMAEGFQRGMDRGYREGHGSGMRSGLETGLAQGHDEGRREGMEQGRREALLRFEAVAAPLDAMLQTLRRLEDDYQTGLRKEVVELVAKVAREVIRAELVQKPEQLLAFVDATLATMPRTPKKNIEVHVNKQDLERILALNTKASTRWNLIGDDHLEQGECRIKAGNREADAGCGQRLAACMEQITAQLLPQDGSEAPPA